MSGAVEVRGTASAEELAAVLAALSRRAAARTRTDRYEAWRRTRLAALTQAVRSR